MVEDVKSVICSLIVDESTDCSINKYLCLCIKYYSKKLNKITIDFLGIVPVERVTAEALFNQIISFLTELGFSLNQLVVIGTDGANNLCGKTQLCIYIIEK